MLFTFLVTTALSSAPPFGKGTPAPAATAATLDQKRQPWATSMLAAFWAGAEAGSSVRHFDAFGAVSGECTDYGLHT